MKRVLWRCLGLLAVWALWPGLVFAAWWLANILLQTGARCSIEGCEPPSGDLARVLWLFVSFAPPAWLTWRIAVRRHG